MMQVAINARGQSFLVDVPEPLIQKAVTYAMGVIAQRETASMGEKERKPDGTPYTEKDRLGAIADRFAKIEKGEWAESGGRAADPTSRELAALVRTAAIRKKAATPYSVDDVPGASDAAKLMAFVVARFGKERAAKLATHAASVARAREKEVI